MAKRGLGGLLTADGVPSEEAWEEAAPRPEALVESLRSFGYSPETAIADLLDNSMSAKANRMDLRFVWAGHDSHVAVIDDGAGMSEAVLQEAMRPGSMSPLQKREQSDLGRFGLGLKTASFSQARELTVVTRTARGSVSVRRWDLDLIGETSQWRLLKAPAAQAEAYVQHVGEHGGTAVVWTKCDRLLGDVDKSPRKANDRFLAVAASVGRHLGMTFHRFLVGRGRNRRVMTVNGHEVEPWDPILAHPATHALGPADRIPFMGSSIVVQPYVLPHRSKLDESQQKLGAGIRGWTAHQGFYVYRNDRLVVAGDWLGAAGAKDEHTKLARIVVDFKSDLDLAWQIDVKKSTARPPGVVMDDLKRVAAATRRSAEEVYRHRGNVVSGSGGGTRSDPAFVMTWEEYKDRSGDIRLRLNREHPVLADALAGPLPQRRAVERVLKLVEQTIPTSLIGIRLAESLDKQTTPYETNPAELTKLLKYSLTIMIEAGRDRASALDQLRMIEPFCNYPAAVEALKDEDA